MANPFDQFDGANPFDKFDATPAPTPSQKVMDFAQQNPLVQAATEGFKTGVEIAHDPANAGSIIGKKLSDAKNWLEAPTATPTNPVDFQNRVVPTSALKTAYGTVMMPINALKGRYDNAANLGSGVYGNDPLEAMKQFVLNEGKQGYDLGKGAVMGTTRIPRAPFSAEARNDILTDPVGTALMAYPLAQGVKGLMPKARPAGPIADLAAKFDIPTTLGEQTGNPMLQRVETLNEKVPFSGMNSFRKAQNAAADLAAKTQLSKYIADPAASDAALANRDFASGLYENVKGLVKDVPNQEIAPTQTRGIAQNLLTRYPDLFKKLQDTKTEGIINDIANGTRDTIETVPASKILDASGQPMNPEITTTTPKTLTFDEAWTLRQGLGEKIGQARKLLARGDLDQTAYSQVKQLFSAVSEDINSWTKSIGKPEIADQFKAANDAYKNFVVKHDILQRAYDKAVGTVGAGEMFSPKKFSTALKDIVYKDKAYKNFSPNEISQMTGLANIMQVVKRAGQYMENVPTGNRVADAMGLAAITKLPTLPLSWLTTYLTTTAKGQSLARSAASLMPTSAGMNRIIDRLKNEHGLIGTDINASPIRHENLQHDVIGEAVNNQGPSPFREGVNFNHDDLGGSAVTGQDSLSLQAMAPNVKPVVKMTPQEAKAVKPGSGKIVFPVNGATYVMDVNAVHNVLGGGSPLDSIRAAKTMLKAGDESALLNYPADRSGPTGAVTKQGEIVTDPAAIVQHGQEGNLIYGAEGNPAELMPKLEQVAGAVVPEHVQRIVQEPREVPQSVGLQTKEQTKTTLHETLPNGGIARLTNVEELHDIIKRGGQTSGKSFEGQAGISAQLFDNQKPIVGYGKNNRISAAIVYPEDAVIGKGQSVNEVKINPSYDVTKLRFAVDGYPHLFTFAQLKAILNQ